MGKLSKQVKLFKIEEIEHIPIKMPDGIKLSAKVWKPISAKAERFPVVLEYIPYRKRDGTHVRDALTHPYFCERGYVCLRVDLRGNGDSEGLLFDEYTETELSDAEHIIDWASKQSWSNGNIGMMGISWGGFNSLQVAFRKPKALKAIITLCSTVDRYTDDIHYKGGCLLNENLGWGATMLSYSSRPPDPLIVGKKWKKMWLERLKSQPHLSDIWLKHQRRDKYWKHGSVCEDYSKLETPILAIGGWGDAYKNAVPELVKNAKAKGIIGPWVHKYPHFAVPKPQIGFLQEAIRWWDRWLKEIDNGCETDPDYRVYVMKGEPPKSSYNFRDGYWIKEDRWPSKASKNKKLYLRSNNVLSLSNKKNKCQLGVIDSPQHCGLKGGEYCAIWLGPELPGDQRLDDAFSLCFDTNDLILEEDIVGSPELTITLEANSPNGQLAVRLCDVFPDGKSSRITYGILNLRFRESFDSPKNISLGKEFTVKIKLDHIAYKLPKGNKLRLSLSNAYWPLVWPVSNPAKLVVKEGYLSLPLRQSAKSDEWVFPKSVVSKPWQGKEIRKPCNKRQVLFDEATDAVFLDIEDDFGSYKDLKNNLIISSTAREKWSIHPNDPLSAKGETHWTEERSRGDWSIRTETFSSMTSDKSYFYLKARVEAYEKAKLIFKKKMESKIKRVL